MTQLLKEAPTSQEPTRETLHYRLTQDELMTWVGEYDLKWSEVKVYLYFATLNPFGDRYIDCKPAEVCLQLKIKKSAFYQAIGRLEELGLLDMKVVQASIRVFPIRQRIVHLNGKSSTEMEPCPSEWNAVQLNGMLSTEMESRSPEPLEEAGSTIAQTIQTDQIDPIDPDQEREKGDLFLSNRNKQPDLSSPVKLESKETELNKTPVQFLCLRDWGNFSAPGADPDFFEFVCKRAAKFENPVPVDVKCTAEGWIRKQGHILHAEYLAWQEGHKRRHSIAACEPTPPPLPVQPTEAEQRSNALARLRVKFRTPNLRQAAIEEAQRWGFVLGDLEASSHADAT